MYDQSTMLVGNGGSLPEVSKGEHCDFAMYQNDSCCEQAITQRLTGTLNTWMFDYAVVRKARACFAHHDRSTAGGSRGGRWL